MGVTLFGLLLAYAWLVRPVAVEVEGGGYGLEVLQQREGLEIDGTRGYAEMSVVWLEWYQGAAFVVLGFAGAVLLAAEDLDGSGGRPGWLIVAVLAAFAVLYFWRPSINPDQIWAMRRFLTVVMPLGALAAAVAVDRATETVGRKIRTPLSSNATAGVLVLALLVPPVVASGPVWDVAEYKGLGSQFDELCDAVGSDGYVLVVGWDEGVRWTQSLRSYCGAPAAWIEHIDDQLLSEIRTDVEDAGGRFVLMSREGPGRAMLDGPFNRLDISLSQRPGVVIPTDIAVRIDG